MTNANDRFITTLKRIQFSFDDADQHATAYLGGKPVATASRRGVMAPKTQPAWVFYGLHGETLGHSHLTGLGGVRRALVAALVDRDIDLRHPQA